MGAGLVELISEESVLQTAIRRLPEVIAHPVLPAKERGEEENTEILATVDRAGAVLFGPGLGRADSLSSLLVSLLQGEGAPLVIDADGINLLASLKAKRELLRRAKRRVILTPHPLEFARLADRDIAAVQACRLPLAEDFAKDTGAVVVLKGAGTVITDGRTTYINASGSPALAKGGSGDVLAGMITGLLLQDTTPIEAAALGAYLHGAAGDLLEETYSDRGVLPSELPRAAARLIRRLQKDR
jgi:NAD(P)H-hydrate epimerase